MEALDAEMGQFWSRSHGSITHIEQLVMMVTDKLFPRRALLVSYSHVSECDTAFFAKAESHSSKAAESVTNAVVASLYVVYKYKALVQAHAPVL